MTTGQKSLREVAEAARQDKLDDARVKAREEQAKSLQKVVERFHDRFRGFGRLEHEGYEVADPDLDDFVFVKGVKLWGGGINKTADGWKIEVDGVTFLFSTGYNNESFYVMHNCPKCGVEGASHLHGLDELGKLLKFGPNSWTHTCRDREAHDVAYAIGSAARDLKTSPEDVIEAAFELHGDLIRKLMYG